MHRHFLSSVLSIRPLALPLCELARQLLPQGEPLTGTLAAMQRAAGDLREASAEAETFRVACDDLAAALAAADECGLLADLLVADLLDIEAGQYDKLSIKLAAAQLRDPVRRLHVNHVRLGYLAMWHAATLAS